MIVWSGHGILILVLGGVGAFVGALIGGLIFNLLGKSEDPRWTILLSIWSGWLAVFLYAKTIGRTRTEIYLDPKTHREVAFHKRHSLFFIPARGWMWISGIFACFMTVMCFVAKDVDQSMPADHPVKLLKNAERAIASYEGKTGYGNTPEAIKLAETFSGSLQLLRDNTITSSGQKGLSLSEGHFLTYCQISDHGIAYLVHVPSLRKFTREAKDFLGEGARTVAAAVSEKVSPRPPRIAVALRGSFSYESVSVSTLAEEGGPAPGASLDSGKSESLLLPFFQPDTPKVPQPSSAASSPILAAKSATEQDPQVEPVAAAKAAPVVAMAKPEAPPLPTAVRAWKSSDGRPMEAALIRFLPGEPLSAEFKLGTGAVHTIAIERFSEEDQKELREIAASVAK